MFIVNCPYCGDRDQTEFSCHGEAHIPRPTETVKMTDEQWGDYVFFRTNPKGYHRERWLHDHGCRRWFNALRHTVKLMIPGLRYLMTEVSHDTKATAVRWRCNRSQ